MGSHTEPEKEHHHDEDAGANINVRAAIIHVIGDLIQSAGVAVAGAIIWARPDWAICDPIMTYVFSVLVLLTTWNILKESVRVLMEGTPQHVDETALFHDFMALPGVLDVHDFHIWSISAGKTALTCHMRANDPDNSLLEAARNLCFRKYRIYHTTFQIETADDMSCCHPCLGMGAT